VNIDFGIGSIYTYLGVRNLGANADRDIGIDNHMEHAGSQTMKTKNELLSTTDDLIKILMDIYNLTEKEAKGALKEVTSHSNMTDF
jgi:hypothetical protein